MGKSAFFQQAKDAFDSLSINHVIGDPHGQLAYAYIRVSSEEQADDKRSGLARQIAHCHEIAREKGYCIPWDFVYADDDSGFEFENRASLTRLRKEYKSPVRRANAIVMEYLDRLSRNADWHQGYLLDEMKRHGIEAIFWKPFQSRVERAVMGAVSQDAMELSLARMYEGARNKAKSGRVTARTRAYGYRFVDSKGQESPAARKDTHYAVYEPEAQVIRRIFTDVANGKPLRRIAAELSTLYPSPAGKSTWGKSTLTFMIKRPSYKGEFHAFRWSKDRQGHHIENDDYIVVDVPAIVSVELWDAANRMLEKNRETASRNAKRDYLLRGLVKCAKCSLAYVGHGDSKRSNGRQRVTPNTHYVCSSKDDYRRHALGCNQGKIGCKKLDNAVWRVVCSMLLEPKILMNALEQRFNDASNTMLLEQIEYLKREVEAKQHEEERLYRAYLAGAFDEHEFAAQRRVLKDQSRLLVSEIERLQSMVLTHEEVELEKQFVFNTVERLQRTYDLADVPFDVKQRILKMVVDRIVLNTNEGWFRLMGGISGIYSLLDENPNQLPPSPGTTESVGELSKEDNSPKKHQRSAIANMNTRIPGLHREGCVESLALQRPSHSLMDSTSVIGVAWLTMS